MSVVLALGVLMTAGLPATASPEAEILLPDVGDADGLSLRVDEDGVGRVLVRAATTGALRYFELHAERATTVELVTPAATHKERQQHQSGMAIDGSGQPVVWSAGHQFRREADGQWHELDATVHCEQIAALRERLFCAAVVPGSTVGAPKHWTGEIIGGAGPGFIPFAWRVNTDTLALFAERNAKWTLLALVDRESHRDSAGPNALAVDAESRLHIISERFLRHAVYAPPSDGSSPVEEASPDLGAGQPPAAIADLHSSPVTIRITVPGYDIPIEMSEKMPVKPLWKGGASFDAWRASLTVGSVFNSQSSEFVFLRAGYSTRRHAWLFAWRLRETAGDTLQVIARDDERYLSGALAISRNGRLHVLVERYRNRDDPAATLDYLTLDANGASAPVRVNELNEVPTFSAIAANSSGAVLVIFGRTDGRLVARWIEGPTPTKSSGDSG
jgi:hypothetical protein